MVLFPGNPSQISKKPMPFCLSWYQEEIRLFNRTSGKSSKLKQTQLEIISTGYILVDGGNETAVERVSQTKPLDRNNLDLVLATGQAGEMLR
jgi:putative glycerol-1-phosphate prenyltransferase